MGLAFDCDFTICVGSYETVGIFLCAYWYTCLETLQGKVDMNIM